MLAVYRRLLTVYPASFRARFGEEMLQFVRDEAASGRRVRWTRTLADLLGSAVVQRSKGGHMRTKLAVAAFIVVGVVGGTMLVTGAIFNTSSLFVALAVFAALGVVYGIAALAARRTKGAEFDYRTRAFRWWWVPAGLLGAFQLVFMIGQLIDDPKIENVFALAIMGVFSALVFGGMATRNRKASNWMIATGVLPMLPLGIWIVVPSIVALVVIVMALSDNIRMGSTAPAGAA
jgi:hypothetical protein